MSKFFFFKVALDLYEEQQNIQFEKTGKPSSLVCFIKKVSICI